jgi:hypothetical protein
MSSRTVKKTAQSASTPPTPPAPSKSAQKAPRSSRSIPSAKNNNFDSDFDAQDVLVALLEASYFLAVLTEGEGSPVFPPSPAYILQPPADLAGPYLRLLNTVLANLRVARVRLSAVSEEDSLEAHVLSPDRAANAVTSFPLVVPTPNDSPASAVAFSAAKSSRSDVRPQRALFPSDAQGGDKLAKSTRALRLTRQALRQLECVERQAELARSAIAGQRIAHHALRDYRTKANRHVAVANGELRALILRTSTLEELEPEVPGRNSPPPQIPSTLGELPALAAVEEAAVDIRRFSQEDFTLPSPSKVGERAKRVASRVPSPTARADKRPPSPEPPTSEPGRAPTRRKRAK